MCWLHTRLHVGVPAETTASSALPFDGAELHENMDHLTSGSAAGDVRLLARAGRYHTASSTTSHRSHDSSALKSSARQVVSTQARRRCGSALAMRGTREHTTPEPPPMIGECGSRPGEKIDAAQGCGGLRVARGSLANPPRTKRSETTTLGRDRCVLPHLAGSEGEV